MSARHTPSVSWSRKARTVAVDLGLDLECPALHRPRFAANSPGSCARRLIDGLLRGGHQAATCLALAVGPSGSGKSTLLRAAGELAARRGWTVIDLAAISPRDRVCIDLFRSPPDASMRALAAAGLAEARCFFTTPSRLSAGQRDRLRLALAFHALARCRDERPSPTLLLLDEFCSSLDALTSVGVAALLRRFLDRANSTNRRTLALVATHKPELRDVLRPERLIDLDFSRDPLIEQTPAPPTRLPALPIRVEPGSLDDYHALSAHHYRAGTPRSIAGILGARLAPGHGATGALRDPLVGVLVVTHPTLNGSWREHAAKAGIRGWLGFAGAISKRERAHMLNDPVTGVRRIARVIVDPRFRSLGVATQLVRAYLDSPLTTRTEALAAMAVASEASATNDRTSVCFFERAGMARVQNDHAPHHARLLNELARHGLNPLDFATPTLALERWIRAAGRAEAARALRRWARSSRATARHAEAPLAQLFRLAARSAASRPAAFVHTSAATRVETETN